MGLDGYAEKTCENISIEIKNICASAGNRTRAARVAGEHSTTEPPMLHVYNCLTLFVDCDNDLSLEKTYVVYLHCKLT